MKRFFLALLPLLILSGISERSLGQAPPLNQLIGWWKADAGVVASPHPGPSSFALGRNSVTIWEDQSANQNHAVRLDDVPYFNPANGQRLQFGPAFVEPSTATFGNGTHAVLNFFKAGWFNLNAAPLINHPDVTIYAVVEQTLPTVVERREFFSVYDTPTNFGSGYGVSIGTEGPSGPQDLPELRHGVRLFNGVGHGPTAPFTYEQQDYYYAGALDDEQDGSVVGGWHQLTAQFMTSNVVTPGVDAATKELFVDGVSQGEQIFEGMVFTGNEGASIGTLGRVFELQLGQCGACYNGGLAEILVYSNADDAQRLEVEAYLNRKYFSTNPGLQADLDQDNDVDGADFLQGQRERAGGDPFWAAWQAEFGTTISVPSAASAPEPTGLAILMSAIVGWGVCRRRTPIRPISGSVGILLG